VSGGPGQLLPSRHQPDPHQARRRVEQRQDRSPLGSELRRGSGLSHRFSGSGSRIRVPPSPAGDCGRRPSPAPAEIPLDARRSPSGHRPLRHGRRCPFPPGGGRRRRHHRASCAFQPGPRPRIGRFEGRHRKDDPEDSSWQAHRLHHRSVGLSGSHSRWHPGGDREHRPLSVDSGASSRISGSSLGSLRHRRFVGPGSARSH